MEPELEIFTELEWKIRIASHATWIGLGKEDFSFYEKTFNFNNIRYS
jgi:hypothetical protein